MEDIIEVKGFTGESIVVQSTRISYNKKINEKERFQKLIKEMVDRGLKINEIYKKIRERYTGSKKVLRTRIYFSVQKIKKHRLS